jgi:hypothetical protein
MKTTAKIIYRALTSLVFACFLFPPAVGAVSPAPDGGYPGGNTAEGQNALFSLTTGVNNTAIGYYSLKSDATHSNNTAIGTAALYNNNADGNTATGCAALLSNTVGTRNTADGAFALYHSTGNANTAVGYEALFSNTTATNNTADGAFALFSNSTGYGNTAVGAYSLYVNSSGRYNTATGVGTLENNIFDSNTADGYTALLSNTTGANNTASGAGALTFNTIGNDNTAVGYQALNSNDSADDNTAIGYNALSNVTSGTDNTAIGYGAGINQTTGSVNVYIGQGVGGVTGELGHTYIRNINATSVSGGNTDYVTVDLFSGLLGHLSSSRRYKEDVKPMDDTSEALYQLKPVTYRYKKELDPTHSRAFGLVAEEVAEINPALVARNSQGEAESIHYEMVNAMLLNEFLKEHRKVETLEATVANLVTTVKEQAAQIQKVSAQLEVNKAAPQVAGNN